MVSIVLIGCTKEEIVCNTQSIVGDYVINDASRNDTIRFTQSGTYFLGEVYVPYSQDCENVLIGANAVYRYTQIDFVNGVLYFSDDTHISGWTKL